jgi:hypothetical protein
MQLAIRKHHSELSGRCINVELTAGGGGNSDQRKEKLRVRNRTLDEQRVCRHHQIPLISCLMFIIQRKRALIGQPRRVKPRPRRCLNPGCILDIQRPQGPLSNPLNPRLGQSLPRRTGPRNQRRHGGRARAARLYKPRGHRVVQTLSRSAEYVSKESVRRYM